MSTIYTQKQSSIQKKDAPSASSVLDASSQSESLQRKIDMANNAAQRAEAPRPNNTGMPDNLKAGIENLSGFSMDDVRVHYNSSKPATVQALAYTQGADIHVAPGQEKCLPHEAWHVAQQMAGRVSPTTNINGMPVNDNAALEHEADVMGERAVTQRKKCSADNMCNIGNPIAQRVVQMAGHTGAFLDEPNDAPYMLKIVDEKEYGEYSNINAKQNLRNNEGNRYRSVFPLVYGLWNGETWISRIDESVNFRDNRTNPAREKYVVAIQKLNKFGGGVGHDAHIFDFKIGKTTASKGELVHSGKTESAATRKKIRMKIVDLFTGSSAYGIRDSDNTGDIEKIRRVVGRLDPEKQRQFREDFAQQCNTISDYIQNAETLYIASSILVGYDNENNVVVKMIDLAHPISQINSVENVDGRHYETAKFTEIREGMLLGIRNLRTLICSNDDIATV